MNALARYLLVFLLGWAGAVFTYSDLIYQKKNAPFDGTLNEKGVALDEETGKPLIQTEDVSPSKKLKLPPTARGRFIQKKSSGGEQPKP